MSRVLHLSTFAAACWFAGPESTAGSEIPVRPALGKIVRLDSRFDALVARDARLEVLALDLKWVESPLWVPESIGGEPGGALLFAEMSQNRVLKWTEAKGVAVFLHPSGYTGLGQYSQEPGSNGMALDAAGRLIFCEQGDRRVTVLVPGGGKRTLCDAYYGKRFNCPNDLAIRSNGDIYFTDPYYGLPTRRLDDPARELSWCGVYRYQPQIGRVTLLADQIERPNGIGFSPDERTLYVSNSNPDDAKWLAFPVRADGTLGEMRVFKDVTAMRREQNLQGVPDGLEVDAAGRIWSAGPGGIHVMLPDGTLLGRIDPGVRTSNCCFGGPDRKWLFITADMYLLRIRLK